MKIITYASSSEGNLYKLQGVSEELILEAGLPINKILKHLNFDFSNISGCLISHEHKDHSKGVEGLLKNAVKCYMSNGTKEALQLDHPYITTLSNEQMIHIGKEWVIMALRTQHDAIEPMGYVIYNCFLETKLLFITDTYYFEYQIPSLTHIMIESNYNLKILDDNIKNGIVEPARRNRILRSHFEESRVLEFFKANDLSRLQEVLLIHASKDSSSDNFDKILQHQIGYHIKVSYAE